MRKVCVICGVEFDGHVLAKTCGVVCRKEKARQYRQTTKYKATKRKYSQTPNSKQYNRQRQRQRMQMPGYKEHHRQRQRQRMQTPEYKEYIRQYKQTPEYKEYQRQYEFQRRQTHERQEYNRQRMQTPEYKEYQRQRRQNESTRLAFFQTLGMVDAVLKAD